MTQLQTRQCPQCGEAMSTCKRKVPEGSKQKGWRWICKPCANAEARVRHQLPHYQAAKQKYRADNAKTIADGKSAWTKQDRAKFPEKYQAQSQRSHEQLMADPVRLRNKYDKANEQDRQQLIELKKDPIAYEAHLNSEKERNHRRREENGDHINFLSKESHYRTKYGMSLQQLKILYAAQDEKCCICSADLPDPSKTRIRNGKGSWHLDHCHETKKVRGLLCNRCNMGLGLFRDDPLRLQQAINYLNGGNESIVSAVLLSSDERFADGGVPDASANADP